MTAVRQRARRRYYGTRAPVTPASGLAAIAPRGLDWQNDAACREVGPELFFDAEPHSREAGRAKALCRACPVRTQCLEWALEFTDDADQCGIFGGAGPTERKRMRRERRQDQEVAA